MPRTGRPKAELTVTQDERVELERLARRGRTNRDLVERFFGLLTEQALKRGSFTSIPQLRTAILDYVGSHNQRNKPFRWTKTADEILDKMRRFGLRTQQVHGG
jgi:hypothetical protein